MVALAPVKEVDEEDIDLDEEAEEEAETPQDSFRLNREIFRIEDGLPVKDGMPSGEEVAKKVAASINQIRKEVQKLMAGTDGGGANKALSEQSRAIVLSLKTHTENGEAITVEGVAIEIAQALPPDSAAEITIQRKFRHDVNRYLADLTRKQGPLVAGSLRNPQMEFRKGYFLKIKRRKEKDKDIDEDADKKAKLSLLVDYAISLAERDRTGVCRNCVLLAMKESVEKDDSFNMETVQAIANKQFPNNPEINKVKFMDVIQNLRDKSEKAYGFAIDTEIVDSQNNTSYSLRLAAPETVDKLISLLRPDSADMETLGEKIPPACKILGKNRLEKRYRRFLEIFYEAAIKGRNMHLDDVMEQMTAKGHKATPSMMYDYIREVHDLNRMDPAILGFDIRQEARCVYRLVLTELDEYAHIFRKEKNESKEEYLARILAACTKLNKELETETDKFTAEAEFFCAYADNPDFGVIPRVKSLRKIYAILIKIGKLIKAFNIGRAIAGKTKDAAEIEAELEKLKTSVEAKIRKIDQGKAAIMPYAKSVTGFKAKKFDELMDIVAPPKPKSK